MGVAGGQHAGFVGGEHLVANDNGAGGAGLETSALPKLLGGVGGIGIIHFEGRNPVRRNVQHAVQQRAGGNGGGAVLIAPGVRAVLGPDRIDAVLGLQRHEAGFEQNG